MTFYTYKLIDPRTNLPFYIGKGQAHRYKAHESEARTNNNIINRAKCDFIRDIWEAGMNVGYELTDHPSEEAALIEEQLLIKKHGRRIDGSGILFNVDRGGRDRWKPKTSNKAVYVYDRSGFLNYTFDTAKKAAQFFDCDSSVISSRARRTKMYLDTWVLSYKVLTNEEITSAFDTSRAAKRPVIQYTLDGIVVATHESTYAAGRAIGGSADTIYTTIHAYHTGKRKAPNAGGFRWDYAPV